MNPPPLAMPPPAIPSQPRRHACPTALPVKTAGDEPPRGGQGMSCQPHVGQGFSTAPCTEQPRQRAGMAGMARSLQLSRARSLQPPAASLAP